MHPLTTTAAVAVSSVQNGAIRFTRRVYAFVAAVPITLPTRWFARKSKARAVITVLIQPSITRHAITISR